MPTILTSNRGTESSDIWINSFAVRKASRTADKPKSNTPSRTSTSIRMASMISNMAFLPLLLNTQSDVMLETARTSAQENRQFIRRRLEMQIKFQTALITGSSRGLGRQIALKLAAEGVRKIAIHYRTGRSDAETTLSLIESAGASGVLVQGDVADPVAAESLVKEAAQKLGGC